MALRRDRAIDNCRRQAMKQMNRLRMTAYGLSIAMLAGGAGCGDTSRAAAESADKREIANASGPKQTRFPGQVTAGGGTSGEVIARAGGAKSGAYMGGTPGIPMGSGGNTGGPATGGTVQQPPSPPSGAIPPPGEAGKGGK
jgi:hypothetical protein